MVVVSACRAPLPACQVMPGIGASTLGGPVPRRSRPARPNWRRCSRSPVRQGFALTRSSARAARRATGDAACDAQERCAGGSATVRAGIAPALRRLSAKRPRGHRRGHSGVPGRVEARRRRTSSTVKKRATLPRRCCMAATVAGDPRPRSGPALPIKPRPLRREPQFQRYFRRVSNGRRRRADSTDG